MDNSRNESWQFFMKLGRNLNIGSCPGWAFGMYSFHVDARDFGFTVLLQLYWSAYRLVWSATRDSISSFINSLKQSSIDLPAISTVHGGPCGGCS